MKFFYRRLRRKLTKVIYILIACNFASCTITKRPIGEVESSLEKLDYSQNKNWAFNANLDNHTDLLPKNIDAELKIDSLNVNVFYIHPTTLLNSYKWNSDTTDFKDDKIIDLCLNNQASVFAGVCDIYAPNYRQMNIYGYTDTLNGYKAFDLAYDDILNAFKYFIKNINNNNKFILAGHSQGTNHAERLINDYISIEETIKNNLILAYLVGMPIKKSFDAMPLCEDSSQLNCFISWRSFSEFTYPKKWKNTFGHGKHIYSVNPITWKKDSIANSSTRHKGILLSDKRLRFRKSLIIYNHEGMIWIKKPKNILLNIMSSKNYHIADYNLYWPNIRENLKLRISKLILQAN